MAKIIKNNVVYNQSPATASGVAYDNTDSGLTSNTVQGAVDEIVNDIPTTADDIEYSTGVSVKDELDDKADKIDIPEYDATHTYNAGDYVTYDNKIYACIVNITTPETWTPSHWIISTTPDNSYLHSVNPNGVGTFSMNRSASSTSTVGEYSFAEGFHTTSSAYATHSEGFGTQATTDYAHSEGSNTIANHKSQHVFGEYNIADTSTATKYNRGNYVEIVGNGTSSARSNARTLDWNGNETLAGTLSALSLILNETNINFTGAITDLDVSNITIGEWRVNSYGNSSTHSPSGSAGGWVITIMNSGTARYGAQIAISNNGFYYRSISGLVFGTWRTIATA